MGRFIPLLVLLDGCALPGILDCVGQMTGAYAGELVGTLEAELSEDGQLAMLFRDAAGEEVASGTGTVADDGTVTGSAGGIDFSGVFDFEACVAGGDYAGAGTGTWDLER